ncbi:MULTISPECIES: NAD(P)/FAD-dependent oxidoreductase [unclassified Arthrobacter]|uniref:NAD(P)/FAD-dependent oxidoreductase n=1 Tax=unclassified Arthrobacter TaxID=235627 RepID=UPI002E073019|nr:MULTISPECIES: FAD-dependent oxidoreductase [unclassified Arthrobacter]MEC5191132.1 putative NAD/FAD-binding protein [Arthrobacter sp. MP_M4]MEC5202303.1 putative NAD/FAD-binding protein [Arthrobacter sp. MP_M7]
MSDAAGIPQGRRVAVIGSGVAGLTAAYVLNRQDTVTLFEADSRLGGHAHTHDVAQAGGPDLRIDTGFIVHNERTYPTLLRLFAELGIETQDSEMSMSVRCDGCGLEYAGARAKGRGILPGPATLLRGRYLLMLLEVMRFYRKARVLLAEGPPAGDSTGKAELTLGQFLSREKFSTYFISHFMTPIVSAVWSCDPTTALAYPARYLFTFLGHHGLLGVSGSPQWRTVTGGSRSYVDKLAATLPDIRLASPVAGVRRHADGVELTYGSADGGLRTEAFDAVVIATHPAQALAMLTDASAAEQAALAGMPYSVNHTVFHRDDAVLPASDNAKASWNYRLPSCDARPDKVLVSYDMTRLQRLDPADGGRYIVSLGESELIADTDVLDRMVYEHPQYTPDSLRAQEQILALGDDRLAFAGAYHGWGFHEDGALSGVRAAERLGRGWNHPAVALNEEYRAVAVDPDLQSAAAEGA